MFRIETERLLLRKITPQDFDTLSAVHWGTENMKPVLHFFDAPKVKNRITRNKHRYRVFSFGL